MKIKNIVLLFAITITIIGCGGPSSIMLKPDAMTGIKSIAVIEMKEPAYFVMDLSSGTPWGAAAEKKRADEIKPKFVGILKKEKFIFTKQLSQQLHRSLRKAGYKTYAIKAKRGDKPAFLESYEKYKSGKVDALLDILPLGAGYTLENALISNFWRPQAEALVRLVDAKTGKILYQDRLMYGHHNPFISGVDLDAPKKFHFNKREDIFKAGNKVIVAGLKDGAKQIANYLGKSFRK